MIRSILFAALVPCLFAIPASAQNTAEGSSCDELVALYIEIARRSGETVTEAQARAEVMSENPSDAECAAMLALFPQQN